MKLKMVVGSEGEVSEKYGGYEIIVHNPDFFPWKDVFNLLADASYEVWIKRRSGRLIILSKPSVD